MKSWRRITPALTDVNTNSASYHSLTLSRSGPVTALYQREHSHGTWGVLVPTVSLRAPLYGYIGKDSNKV